MRYNTCDMVVNNYLGKIFLRLESGYCLEELKGFPEMTGPASLPTAQFSRQSVTAVKQWCFC